MEDCAAGAWVAGGWLAGAVVAAPGGVAPRPWGMTRTSCCDVAQVGTQCSCATFFGAARAAPIAARG